MICINDNIVDDDEFIPTFIELNDDQVVPVETDQVVPGEADFEIQEGQLEDSNILNDLDTSRTAYWKSQKQVKRKSKSLEEIIDALKLSSPQKNKVIQNVVQKHPHSIMHENSDQNYFKNLLSESLLNHLIRLNREKKYPQFHQLINKIFGNHLNDQTFVSWLANKLGIRPSVRAEEEKKI